MFRFTIRDLFWLITVWAVGATGMFYSNRRAQTLDNLSRDYRLEREAREQAEVKIAGLESLLRATQK